MPPIVLLDRGVTPMSPAVERRHPVAGPVEGSHPPFEEGNHPAAAAAVEGTHPAAAAAVERTHPAAVERTHPAAVERTAEEPDWMRGTRCLSPRACSGCDGCLVGYSDSCTQHSPLQSERARRKEWDVKTIVQG
jgi:hypothetical protein